MGATVVGAAESTAGKGYATAVASAVLLSFTGILIKYIGDTYSLPPMVLAFSRNSIVCAVLLCALLVKGVAVVEPLRRNWRFFVCYGGMLAVFNSMWTTTVILNGAAVGTVLVYCSAAYTVVLGRIFFAEPLDGSKLLAVVMCVAGCVLVADALNAETWRLNALGAGAGIASGLLYAGYSIMGRRAGTRGLQPWVTLLYTFGFAVVFLSLFNLIVGSLKPELGLAATSLAEMAPERLQWGGWFALFVLAAGPTLLGFGLYNVSLCYLPSSIANIILTMEPALTAIVAYWWLGETMTPAQWGGAVLILLGVVVLRLGGMRKRRSAQKWSEAQQRGEAEQVSES